MWKNRPSSINLPIFNAFDQKIKFPKIFSETMHFDTLWIFVLGKPDFHSIYYNFQTNCWIILLFFSGESNSLCEHFEPSHTVFNDSQFMLWRHQTSSHPPRWNFATGAEVTNPKTADICKRRRVKGLEIILIEKAINFI